MRLFLEKQREGEKGITFGLKVDSKCSNMLTGVTYDANKDIEAEDVVTLDTAKASIKPGATSQEDRGTIKKKDLAERVSKYNNLLHANKALAKDLSDTSTPETRAKTIRQIKQNEKNATHCRDSIVEMARDIFNTGNNESLLLQMTEQLKEMKKTSSTFAPESINEVEAMITALQLLGKEKVAEA